MESRHKFKFYYCSYYRCAHREGGSGGNEPDRGYRGQNQLIWQYDAGYIYQQTHANLVKRGRECVRDLEKEMWILQWFSF